MQRRIAIAVVVLACCSAPVSGHEAQSGRADALLVLKNGAEVRGQFIGFKDGLFTLRLLDGRTMTYPAGEVDWMQPLVASPPSVPAPAAPVAAPPAATARGPVAAPPVAAPRAPQTNVGVEGVDTSAKAAFEAKACGPEGIKLLTVTDKSQHPTPSAPLDKGLVYVVRPTLVANSIQTRLAVDGSWVGANRGKNYFFFTLDPGEHYFCSQAEDRSALSMTVEAGKTYYLQQKISTGFMKARTSLQAVTVQEGQDGLIKAHLSTWKEMP